MVPHNPLKYTEHFCCRSVTKSCPALCKPMDCSTPGPSVLHCLPELAQIHVHWVSDAIQPSHPLQSPSPIAFNLSQHQGLIQWVGSLHLVTKVLVLQHQSVVPVSIQGWSPLGLTGLTSLLSKGLSRVFWSTSAQHSLWSSSHNQGWLLEKPRLWLWGSLLAKWCLCFLICSLVLS